MGSIHHKQSERGFIALTSTLVITLVLVLLMFSTATSGFYARFDSLDSENKRVSLGLSESCSNAALLKLAQNYSYDVSADPSYVPGKGVPVQVGPDTCYIESIGYSNLVYDTSAPPREIKKTATIHTSAQYPVFSGSFSTNKIQAVVQNPANSVTTPPPTCSFTATAGPIIQGQSVSMQWASAGSATSLSIVRDIGGALATIYNGSASGGPVTDTPSGSATYTATITGPGGSTQCLSPRSVVVDPPPDCADTVMMLDRTGSMSSQTDLNNERAAANGLISLYSGVSAKPKVGVGRFPQVLSGNQDETSAEIIPSFHLNNNYVQLSSGNLPPPVPAHSYTNLKAAIQTASTELSTNGSFKPDGTPFEKVLILISDGSDVNQPCQGAQATCGTADNDYSINEALNAADAAKLADINIFTIHFGDTSGQPLLAELASGSTPFPVNDTGFIFPTSNAQNGGGDNWTNPQNAYVSGVATAVNNANKRHRYQTFNIPTISAGSVISDIQVRADAWYADPINSTASTSPSVAVAPNQFTNPNNAFSSDNVYTTETTNGQQQGYGNFGLNVPVGATIIGIAVEAETKSSDSNGCQAGAELSWNNGANFTSTGNVVSLSGTDAYRMFSGPSNLWGRTWNSSDFTNGKFVVRLQNVDPGSNCTGGSTLSVDHVRVKVYYIVTPSTQCQLGIDLSWNGGTNWSSEQVWNLPAADTTLTFTSAGGWGSHAWAGGDFTNGNFRVRVHAIDPGAGCNNSALTNLDSIQVRVLYGSSHQPGSSYSDCNGNAACENSDPGGADNFFISPNSSDLTAIFNTIGKKVCPAAVPPTPPAPPAAPPPPPAPPPPISIGSWDEIINPLP